MPTRRIQRARRTMVQTPFLWLRHGSQRAAGDGSNLASSATPIVGDSEPSPSRRSPDRSPRSLGTPTELKSTNNEHATETGSAILPPRAQSSSGRTLVALTNWFLVRGPATRREADTAWRTHPARLATAFPPRRGQRFPS